MSRISDIFQLARDTLADPDGQRWSDAQLLRVLDQGHKDIAIKTRMLRSSVTLPLQVGRNCYELPDDCYLVTRALYDNEALPVYSHNQMDARDRDWAQATGETPKAFILDRQNQKTVRIYPTPETASLTAATVSSATVTVSDSYALLAAYNVLISAGVTLDPSEVTGLSVSDVNYGLVTDVEGFSTNSVYGIITDVESNCGDALVDTYGMSTDLYPIIGLLQVYYIAKPLTLATVDDELLTDESFDLALKYYVTGQVLRNDIDQRSTQLAASEMALYDREFTEAQALDFRDNGRTGLTTSTYFNGFNHDYRGNN